MEIPQWAINVPSWGFIVNILSFYGGLCEVATSDNQDKFSFVINANLLDGDLFDQLEAAKKMETICKLL